MTKLLYTQRDIESLSIGTAKWGQNLWGRPDGGKLKSYKSNLEGKSTPNDSMSYPVRVGGVESANPCQNF